MQRLEKWLRKENTDYNNYCIRQENYYCAVSNLGKALTEVFYIREITDWLNNLLRRI